MDKRRSYKPNLADPIRLVPEFAWDNREMAGRDERHILTYSALSIYACLVACSLWRHEPWADEAQAWLLARDGGLLKLWSSLLHYEGTPGLWHTLLWGLIQLGAPYRAAGVLSAVLGFLAAVIVMTRSPFPLVVRVLLPFTYFLCYQYVVVARSYSLLPLLLFVSILLYPRRERSILAFSSVLALLAGVSVHGFLLSASMWITSHLEFLRTWKQLEASTKKRILVADLVYVAILVLLVCSAWPAH
ncbi:MAG: hypothetical protein M3Z32_13655, partial [Acidobacteriota bacterium]|nr:hypothetical protein [Acidobacteriota bacterium]